jgi:predicted nucleic acid-binding protein
MSGIPKRFVLDASVGIKLFVDEEHSERVTRLIGQISEDAGVEIHVPDLFYVECANILLKYARRFGRPMDDCLADIEDLAELSLKNTPTIQLAADALRLADAHALTSYDACYAVLAQKLGVPLVTADARLAQAIDWAVWIGEIAI